MRRERPTPAQTSVGAGHVARQPQRVPRGSAACPSSSQVPAPSSSQAQWPRTARLRRTLAAHSSTRHACRSRRGSRPRGGARRSRR
eukprot:scaffold36275_cov154-Isochrysis_galbana.AAC.17